MAWAEQAPLSTKTNLVTVYQEAANNNADGNNHTYITPNMRDR